MMDDDDISHIECSPLKLRGHYNAIILAAKSESKEARNIFSGKKNYYYLYYMFFFSMIGDLPKSK